MFEDRGLFVATAANISPHSDTRLAAGRAKILSMNEPFQTTTRADFLIGVAASVTVAASAAPTIASAAALPEPEAADSVAIAATIPGRGAWWALFTTWNPGIARFPGSYFGSIMDRAEAGDEASIAFLQNNGMYARVQTLLRMKANGEAIHPISAEYRKPPLPPKNTGTLHS